MQFWTIFGSKIIQKWSWGHLGATWGLPGAHFWVPGGPRPFCINFCIIFGPIWGAIWGPFGGPFWVHFRSVFEVDSRVAFKFWTPPGTRWGRSGVHFGVVLGSKTPQKRTPNVDTKKHPSEEPSGAKIWPGRGPSPPQKC